LTACSISIPSPGQSTCFFFDYLFSLLDLPSFPTRRSSDLSWWWHRLLDDLSSCCVHTCSHLLAGHRADGSPALSAPPLQPSLLADRKSTRLNSSHVSISYAVFCLKKKRTSN